MLKEIISDIIYSGIDFPYCTNCRYNDVDTDVCGKCASSVRDMWWAVSRETADHIADKILTVFNITGMEGK